MARTAGHSLSVVECLRALAAGDPGVPGSLAARSSPGSIGSAPTRAVVEAGAVLRRRLDPRLLAALVGATELSAVRACEELAARRAAVRVGARYEFANDLVQECVYAALAPALAAAYHRRAADLTSDQPETMAEHAFAAGETARPRRAGCSPGRRRCAGPRSRTPRLARPRPGRPRTASAPRARVLLARAGRTRRRTAVRRALADIDEALALARTHRRPTAGDGGAAGPGRRRCRWLRGSPADELRCRWRTDCGWPPGSATGAPRRTSPPGWSCSSRAGCGWPTRSPGPSGSSPGPGPPARQDGAAAGPRRREDRARLPRRRDRLREVVGGARAARCGQRRDTWLLQWAVFESSFVAGAEGRWDEAGGPGGEALEINRRSGFTAYAGYFRAHAAGSPGSPATSTRPSGWAAAAAETSPVDHPWWYATAAGLLAATLLEAGDHARRGRGPPGLAAPSGTRPRPGGCAAWPRWPRSPATATTGGAAGRWPASTARPAGRGCRERTAYLLVASAAAERGTTTGPAGAGPAARRRRQRLAGDPAHGSTAARSDQLGHELSGARGTVGRHRQVVDRCARARRPARRRCASGSASR